MRNYEDHIIKISPKQWKLLTKLAKKKGVTRSALIREAVAARFIMDEMQIGKYTIRNFVDYPDKSKAVWIEQEDGEGGQFHLKSLEAVIEKFYNENF